jgi:hypothetical protein
MEVPPCEVRLTSLASLHPCVTLLIEGHNFSAEVGLEWAFPVQQGNVKGWPLPHYGLGDKTGLLDHANEVSVSSQRKEGTRFRPGARISNRREVGRIDTSDFAKVVDQRVKQPLRYVARVRDCNTRLGNIKVLWRAEDFSCGKIGDLLRGELLRI